MYSAWAQLSRRTLDLSKAAFIGSSPAAQVLRTEYFGPTAIDYTPFGGKLVSYSGGVFSGLATPDANVLIREGDGTFSRGFPLLGQKVLVLRDGVLHADTVVEL